MTITLELSPEQEALLRGAAAQQKTSPEGVVLSLLEHLKSGAPSAVSQDEFEAIAEGVLRDNAELYQRLA